MCSTILGEACELVKQYNGGPAHTVILPEGTELWRVHRSDSGHPANSFNSTGIAPLVDASGFDVRRSVGFPSQGRFDPVHDETVCAGGSRVGGYLYMGLSVNAVVAEGILRGTDIPRSKLLSFATVAELSITKMKLGQHVSVVSLDTQVGLNAINQDASLVACSWRDYRESRMSCTDILVANPDTFGVRYPCRHGTDERAVMLVDRGTALAVDIVDSSDLSAPGWGLTLVRDALVSGFGLDFDVMP
jgi:hypothetical protein